MQRTFKALVISSALIWGLNSASSVQACPMCKGALASGEDAVAAARPKAFMYSILFMLSMPATLATVFGVSFYRLSKRQQAINAALLAEHATSEFDQETDFST